MEEVQQDDDFGFVRRDSAVLQRAMENEGSRTGSQPAAGQEATSGREEVRQQQQQQQQVTVAPKSLPDKRNATITSNSSSTVSRATSLLKRMSVSVGPNSAAASPKEEDLPQSFQVKYLGSRDARGLWGIKHTRRPVDTLVTAAKNMPPGVVLPMVKLTVSTDGVALGSLNSSSGAGRLHPIDTISYGVQDLVYTRVFSMIVVRESTSHHHPFECHAFVCESRSSARRLTYALAAAFNEYSKVVKASGGGAAAAAVRKKFAIDLRTPEEIEAELNCTSRPEVDSEA